MTGTFITFNRLSIALTALCLVGFTARSVNAATQDEVDLQIGVVQRFGDKAKDVMTLKALSGDRLTLRFTTNGKLQTLTTPSLKLETVMQPLKESQADERVVFSTHRSFETAEAQAEQWRAQGIEVELRSTRSLAGLGKTQHLQYAAITAVISAKPAS